MMYSFPKADYLYDIYKSHISLIAMQNDQESGLATLVKYVSSKATDLYYYLQQLALPYIQKGIQKSEPVIERSKEFYRQHKEIVLIVGVASVTYLLVRPRTKEEEKNKKKKAGPLKRQLANKSFISDNSAEEYRQQPSTTVRIESSEKEVLKKKHLEKRVLQRIESSEQSQDGGDKIFFEMYKNYQHQIEDK